MRHNRLATLTLAAAIRDVAAALVAEDPPVSSLGNGESHLWRPR
jgi:hypothetical protein